MDKPQAVLDIPAVEKELQTAVRGIMESSDATRKDFAKLDELLGRKVALMRAPLDAKLKRLYRRAS